MQISIFPSIYLKDFFQKGIVSIIFYQTDTDKLNTCEKRRNICLNKNSHSTQYIFSNNVNFIFIMFRETLKRTQCQLNPIFISNKLMYLMVISFFLLRTCKYLCCIMFGVDVELRNNLRV